MRLRLTIHRNGLPTSRLLWTTPSTAVQANTASGELQQNIGGLTHTQCHTIYQLLEQVNEVFPLEARDWGLDDYVVEVGSYECLHFAALESLFKDGDKVTIRPLQTNDIRTRRISGRYQISADGRHLIDGIPFGRPFVRATSRPPIRIPPRKKARLMLDDEDDEDMDNLPLFEEDIQAGQGQLLIRAPFENADGSDEEEDGDFSPDQKEALEGEGTTDESQDEEENVEITDGDVHEVQRALQERTDQELAKLMNIIGADTPNGGEDRIWANSRSKPGGLKVAKSRLATLENGGKLRRSSLRSSSSGADKSVRFQDNAEFESRKFIAPEDDDSEDDSFEPSDEDVSSEADSDSGSSGSTSDSEDASSSALSAPASGNWEDSNSGSSSNPPDGEEASSPESSEKPDEEPIHHEPKDKTEDRDAPSDPIASSQDNRSENKQTPANGPGQGRKETQKRNERRRNHKRLMRLKRLGILAEDVTHRDLADWQNRQQFPTCANGEFGKEPLSTPDKKESQQAIFDAKRKELLTSLALGGVDISEYSGGVQNALSTPASAGSVKENTSHSQDSTTKVLPEVANTMGTKRSEKQDDIPIEPDKTGEVTSEPPRKRNRLDLSSSRRLLFGALGVRTPKTKEDEEKLRQASKDKAAEIANRHAAAMARAEQAQKKQMESEIDEEDESWKEKIVLSAIECCEDGVVLSTPPFPFRQRWDPQQQWPNSGKKKGKKRKHSQEYYEEQDYGYNEGYDENYIPDEELNYDDDPQEGFDSAKPKNSMENGAVDHDMYEGVEIDLPMVDVSACSALHEADVKKGAIIAFKQLDMSKHTNWQPKLSEFRTATIDKVSEDGSLQLTLAKRDRPKQSDSFDEETGERIYGKFEMPGFDDVDDGVVETTFADLIEAKLVKGAVATIHPEHPESDDHLVNTMVHSSQPEDSPSLVDVESDAIGLPQLEAADSSEPKELEESAAIGKETRQEISKLIKDAGFRSSIGSQLALNEGSNDVVYETAPSGTQFLDHDNITSPRFNGLDLDPLPAISPSEFGGDSVSFHGFSSRHSEDASGNEESSARSVRYPALPQVSSQVFGSNGDRDLQGHLQSQSSKSPASTRTRRSTRSSRASSRVSSSPGQAFTSSVTSFQPASSTSGNYTIDVGSSEIDFPDLDVVFSQTQPGKGEENTSGKASHSQSQKRSLSERSHSLSTNSNLRNRISSEDKSQESSTSFSNLPSAQRMPQPPGADFVLDLTQDSDLPLSSSPSRLQNGELEDSILVDRSSVLGENSDGEYDDSLGLPNGPGCVKKKVPTRGKSNEADGGDHAGSQARNSTRRRGRGRGRGRAKGRAV